MLTLPRLFDMNKIPVLLFLVHTENEVGEYIFKVSQSWMNQQENQSMDSVQIGMPKTSWRVSLKSNIPR